MTCEVTVEVGTVPVVEVEVTAPQVVDVEVTSPVVEVEITAPEVVEVEVTVPELIEIEVSPGLPGPPGPPGTGVVVTAVAGVDIAALVACIVDTDGLAYPASSATAADAAKVGGVTNLPYLTGEVATLIIVGELVTGSPITAGPVFVDVDGSLTTDPDTGVFQYSVGCAVTTGLLIINLGLPIYH